MRSPKEKGSHAGRRRERPRRSGSSENGVFGGSVLETDPTDDSALPAVGL